MSGRELIHEQLRYIPLIVTIGQDTTCERILEEVITAHDALRCEPIEFAPLRFPMSIGTIEGENYRAYFGPSHEDIFSLTLLRLGAERPIPRETKEPTVGAYIDALVNRFGGPRKKSATERCFNALEWCAGEPADEHTDTVLEVCLRQLPYFSLKGISPTIDEDF